MFVVSKYHGSNKIIESPNKKNRKYFVTIAKHHPLIFQNKYFKNIYTNKLNNTCVP